MQTLIRSISSITKVQGKINNYGFLYKKINKFFSTSKNRKNNRELEI